MTLATRPPTFDLDDDVYMELADSGMHVVLVRVRLEAGVPWRIIGDRCGLTERYAKELFAGNPGQQRHIREHHLKKFIAAVNANWRLESFLWLKWGKVPNTFFPDVLALDLMVTLGHPMIDQRERIVLRKRIAAILRPWMQALGIEHY